MTIEEIENEYLIQFDNVRNTGMPIPGDTDILKMEGVPIKTKVQILANISNMYLNQIEYTMLKKNNPKLVKVEIFENFDCGFVDFVADHPNKEYRTEILCKLREYDDFNSAVRLFI